MGVTDRYGIYAVNLNGTMCPVLKVVDAYESTIRGEPRSGEAFARFLSLVAQTARVEFSSEALKVLLDAITTTGTDNIPLKYANIAGTSWGSGGSNALRIYWQKYLSGGSRDLTNVHIMDKVNAGIIALRRLTCQHQGDAVAEVEAVCGWDGTNDLIARTFNVALPDAPTDLHRFTLIDGNFNKIGGIVFGQLRSLEIDFGFGIEREGSGSDVAEKFVTIKTIAPTITLRGIDPALYAAAKIPTGGLNCTHANTKLYLRKRAAGATFVGNGTAEHIFVTADGMAKVAQIGGGSGQDASEIVAILQCRYDGTNAPLIFNTATAIS